MKHPRETLKLSETQKISESRHAEHLKGRILIVDDDPSVREMLTRVLAGEGYSVSAAADGEEALKIVGSHRIDLVLLDLRMPGKSGWDTFERITTLSPLVSVIIITAHSNQLFTALGAGAGALLEKPLDFPKLLQTVSNLLSEPSAQRLARLAGRRVDFHYGSPRAEDQTE